MPDSLIRRSLSSLSAILRRTPGYGVLMYHRIADEPRDPWDLCVSPNNFRAQIEWMHGQGFRFSTVADLAARIANGDDVRQRIAISFDDGYADNYLAAYPVLAALEVPATFFIASQYIETGDAFWWDAVEQLFLESGSLPDWLDLQTSDGHLALDLRGVASDHADHTRWRWQEPAPTPRHAALVATWQQLFKMPPAERDAAIFALYTSAERTYEVATSRRPMTRQELLALAADPNIEIGAHTMRHPNLTVLAPEAQRLEIAGSKHALERMTGRDVRGFAYPNGSYDIVSLRELKIAGFTYACKNCPGSGSVGAYELPRHAVVDAHGGCLSPNVYWHAGLSVRK
ncbi:MAG: polysaccharide deacetylase [Hyphomicrobiales bacterium]|nr:polysaccharide deacetylase [Hyphomicrobiales bacterium]